MNWLEKIGLKLAVNWGIPFVAKLVPWVPAAVWQAISEVLEHLAGMSLVQRHEKAVSFHAASHECLGTACASDLKI